MKSIISLLFGLIFSCGLFAQVIPMYVGSYTSNGSKGLYLYAFNENNGTSEFVKSFSMDNPSFLARNVDYLYVVNENVDGAVTAIDLKKETILNSLPTLGAHPCHVSVSPIDSVIVVSNYSGGSLVLYSLDIDGSLKKQEDFISFKKSSINTQRQNESHIHSAFFSLDGKSLFVSDLGADLIYRYAIDKTSLGEYKFRLIEEIQTKLGGGPRHVVVSSNSNKLFVVLELTGEIELLEKVNNKWISQQILPIAREGFAGTNGAADIKMSLDGKYIYATNRGTSNEVLVYKVQKNGIIKPIQVLSVEGDSPRNIQLSPNGKWIIISNQISGTVNFFKRNIKTGKMNTMQHSISIPSAVCVVF